MKISVAMPTHNAERMIRATLDSVLCQTVAPNEILVLDDGSTDNTVSILQSYGSRITLLRQENKGAAATRNTLCNEASGDLVAFLDHDDIWHPTYLEVQRSNASSFPDTIAFFVGHINFFGYDAYEWPASGPVERYELAIMEPETFLSDYCNHTGLFGSTSFVCLTKESLTQIGSEPFKVDGAEDAYLFTSFPLFGSVGYWAEPLVAYRVTDESQSVNRLTVDRARIETFELLEAQYERHGSRDLLTAFENAYASKQRQFAMRLLGAKRKSEAREQLCASLGHSRHISSIAKSIALLIASYIPGRLQPTWPAARREWQK